MEEQKAATATATAEKEKEKEIKDDRVYGLDTIVTLVANATRFHVPLSLVKEFGGSLFFVFGDAKNTRERELTLSDAEEQPLRLWLNLISGREQVHAVTSFNPETWIGLVTFCSKWMVHPAAHLAAMICQACKRLVESQELDQPAAIDTLVRVCETIHLSECFLTHRLNCYQLTTRMVIIDWVQPHLGDSICRRLWLAALDRFHLEDSAVQNWLFWAIQTENGLIADGVPSKYHCLLIAAYKELYLKRCKVRRRSAE
jgi:hypothetical protein